MPEAGHAEEDRRDSALRPHENGNTCGGLLWGGKSYRLTAIL